MEGDPSELGTTGEVAEFLHVSVGQLANLRRQGNGPPFVKLGKSVLYRWADVYAYLDANTMQRTGDSHPRGSLPHYLVAKSSRRGGVGPLRSI